LSGAALTVASSGPEDVAVLLRLKVFVLTEGVVVDVVVILVTPPSLPLGALLFDTTRIETTEWDDDDGDDDDDDAAANCEVGEDVMVGAGCMLEKVGAGAPVAGMHRDPPQESPAGQQAVTPLNTQVG